MCPPTYVPALPPHRSWQRDQRSLDRGRALEQWEQLAAVVSALIGPVTRLQPEPWAQAMTFTRDLAVSVDDTLIPVLGHNRRGPLEIPLAAKHLDTLGYRFDLDNAPRIDGGNVLVHGTDRLLIGVTPEGVTPDQVAAATTFESLTGRSVYKVPIAGGRFPHLDMALSDLNGKAWLAAPRALPGFDPASESWQTVLRGQSVITADDDDADLLCCNLVTRDDTAIGTEISVGLRRQLEQHGINYVATPLTELRKAGGAARCLTLELPPRTASSESGFRK